jgi:hypothetical protein
LRDAIDTPGQLVSLSGPSKSGKTVLVENVVGRDQLITITGASIKSPEDVWTKVLDWIEAPVSVTTAKTIEGTFGGEVAGKVGAGIPLIVKSSAAVTGKAEVTGGIEKGAVEERTGLQQVIREIGDSDFVVLLDDFHYMDREVQVEVAKNLKEAVRLGVKIITASVRHRGDDVVRANPELRGRVRAINLQYWSLEDLRQIAKQGFDVLNSDVDDALIETFVGESAGSPQLMQLLCLQACFVLGLRTKELLRQNFSRISKAQIQVTLEQASANTDFRSLVDVLDAGPKTRGSERKTYKFVGGGEGDVYRCVLKAVASDPPRLTFRYDDLLERTVAVCAGESPVGSSVTGTCLHMSKLALEKFPNERAIDWDEQKQILDIPDPYLLFFLRWSGRLDEA